MSLPVSMREVLALAFVVGFFAIVAVVLIGVVDVENPTMAKIIGAVFGFISAKVDVILYRYFGRKEDQP